MTFITKPSNNENGCQETQKNTCRRDCNGYQSPPSRKKSNCHTERHPSFQGCIELSVDKCRLAPKPKTPNGSKSKLCISQQSPRLKRSPNGSKLAICGSRPAFKPKDMCEMQSSCCAAHAPKLKKASSGSSSKICASRKSSKQSMRGKTFANTGDGWCDCRNMKTEKIDCDRKVCLVPGEGQYVRNEWWCDCRGATKYTGKKLCVRPGPILPKPNLRFSDLPLEGDTTYKTDYTGKYQPPRDPIKQFGNIHAKCGPMSSLTTQKVDYQPKPMSKRDPIYPTNSTFGSKNPMEGETTTKHDYQVPRGFIPSKSFRPIQACKPYLDPMQDETTQKADYVDWHTRGPQGPFPWTPGNKFMYPTIPMIGDTTYKTDYTPYGMGDRRMPIIPKGQGIGDFGNSFDGCTTYKHDYVPWECVNENDYNAPQGMIKCYKLEGETPQDPDKKLWCYKSEDVCPYYPPKPIDGALAGTTQVVVRPSEGEKPCVAPKPPFNTKICDSETQLRITCPPVKDKSENIFGCGNENSYSQLSQPANHFNSVMHETKGYNHSACQPCGPPKKETKDYNYDTNQTCATKDYNYSSNQPCGPDNYNYSVNQLCRPSKQETMNYNNGTNQTCGNGDYNYSGNQPCGSPKQETKKCTHGTNQVCGTEKQVPQPTYAPFQECSHTRPEPKPTLATNHHDPCCGTTSQYKPKESCETSPSKPFYSIGQKYDQNCACMSQPTSRFTTQEERVLNIHC